MKKQQLAQGLVRPDDPSPPRKDGVEYSIEDELAAIVADNIKMPSYVSKGKKPVCVVETVEALVGRMLDEIGADRTGPTLRDVVEGRSREIAFRDGITAPVTEAARRALSRRWRALDGRGRARMEEFVGRSHGNYQKTLAMAG